MLGVEGVYFAANYKHGRNAAWEATCVPFELLTEYRELVLKAAEVFDE